ncbi:tumor necrosis factor ligand superfamily member 10 isoform X2 [Myotis lucifugus]|uniref:tumor necrosis factor ligand superfamily member 10 isoform X2 n=1 Tax=Myotis lucifugus TaxID=59463 RepID=UPI000CCBE9CE|nr:tumor necrosis factor ligand superfamily member 10 isoform X2 [Myotis lucifugus]
MTAIMAPEKSSPGLRCWLILTFTVFLQCVCVAMAYMYFTSELQQMQDKYFKTSIACFLKEDDNSWDFNDENLNDPCWQVKWQLRQFVRKISLGTYEETISTVSDAKDEKILGHKITSWESSRRGHSLLSNFHLRNGELVIHQTGFYYIYSQTYFRFLEPENDSTVGIRKKNKQMVQYIYKVTDYPEPILLMKSARNSCWSKDSQYGLYSIYQGGIYELQENDRIFVSVTNAQLVDMDQQASYFGAFLIG